MKVTVAPDKFRGTVTAVEVAEAVLNGVRALGHDGVAVPLADGGEGTVDVVGGANRWTTVTGPLGDPVEAGWWTDGSTAVIEMAAASGLQLAGGPRHNDPMAATTRGTGELIGAALASGVTRVLVGAGGSATTDGGLGAVEALGRQPFTGVTVSVCADVTTRFTDAARVFGPQKGAGSGMVTELTARLENLRSSYLDDCGVDVDTIPGSGAAGGLAGGLVTLGATVVDGFATFAALAGLDAALADADLVVTGEGLLDAASFQGKVVGGVVGRAAALGIQTLVIVGQRDIDVTVPDGVTVVGLVERFGRDLAFSHTAECIEQVVREHLSGTAPGNLSAGTR